MDMEIDSYAVKSQGEVEHLTARLKKLKEDLREYQVGDHVLGSQIPPHLREEIAKIYDEHGGIEILMEITKVAYNTIKQWHSKYKRNPTYFQYLNPCARFYRRRTFVDGIEKSDFDTPVKSTPDKMDKEQLKISQQFKNAKTSH